MAEPTSFESRAASSSTNSAGELAARTDALRAALKSLNAWLGAGDNGDRWRTYLLLQPVTDGLSAGPAGLSRDAVGRSWARFASLRGIDGSLFAPVRDALGNWWRESVMPSDQGALTAESLRQVCEAGKHLFVAVDAPDVDHARKVLTAALRRLEARLAGGQAPDGVSAADLDLAGLSELIAAETIPAVDASTSDIKLLKAQNDELSKLDKKLKEIEDRFWAKDTWLARKAGLEKPVYFDVGDAIRIYRQTLEAARLDRRNANLALAKDSVEVQAEAFKKYAQAEDKGPAILKRLQFDDFLAELNSPEPRVDKLRDFVKAFDQPLEEIEGVNRNKPQALAGALRRYADLLAAKGYTQLQLDFEQSLAATDPESKQPGGLADALVKLVASPTAEAAEKVNRRLSWLVDHGQALPLRQALRRFETHPNFYAEFAKPLAAIGIDRPVDEPIEITDNILGTQVRGRGITRGAIGLGFHPHASLAMFSTRLQSTTATNTVGVNGPATIWATGATSLDGSAIIEMDANGARWRQPTVAASTSTRIDGVATRSCLKIVQRIATKRVYESKSQAEQTSAQHAASRAVARMTNEVSQNVAKANQSFLDNFRYPLLRRRAFPDPLRMSTSDGWVQVSAVQARRGEVAALGPPPQPVAAGDALRVQLHDTAINNWAQAMLGGATVTKALVEEWQANAKKGTGETPDEEPEDHCQEPGENKPADVGKPAAPGPEAKPRDDWKMVFADEQPLVVAIEDGKFAVTIRAAYIKSGDNEAYNNLVRAEYKVSQRCDGVRLERLAFSVSPYPGPIKEGAVRPSTIKEIGSRARIKTRLQEELFPEMRVTKGLKLPGAWAKAGRLPLRFLKLDQGWAALGWDLPAPKSKTPQPATPQPTASQPAASQPEAPKPTEQVSR